MNIITSEKPSIAIETVILLARHAQRIDYSELKHRFRRKNIQSLPVEEIPEIEEAFDILRDIELKVCGCIAENDALFKYFFCDNADDDSSEKKGSSMLSVAFAVVFALSDPCIAGYCEQKEHIKKTWTELNEKGYSFANTEYKLDIVPDPDAVMGVHYLFEQIEHLTYPESFRYKLYKFFIQFDDMIDTVFDYMQPFAVQLEHELVRLDNVRNRTVQHWSSALTNRREYGLIRNCLAAFEIDEMLTPNIDVKFNVFLCEPNILSVSWDASPESGGKTLLLGCGFDIRNNLKLADTMPESGFCFSVMKALSDSSKLKMLRAMRKKFFTCSTLAAELDLDVGNTSRNLRTLNELGFLISQKSGGRTSYRTDPEAVEYLLKCVRNFILE